MNNSIKLALAMSLLLLLITYDRTISYWNKPKIQPVETENYKAYKGGNNENVIVIGRGAGKSMHGSESRITARGGSFNIAIGDSAKYSKK